ncbi:hypothetical protein [Acetonema longum]|uniref:Uncharacterized protein n=1 Tax=Acetonema longum DSM 6540 TaxID=1009370 RepID=F7NN10_9FIRM|nr:hypothetical protein [Acetonema longum]EGO62588.1 hypothetical protein ALO_17466 [Acetonema longum DSM 6540]
MKRIEQKMLALEKALQHVNDPDNIIIYEPGPGEPEKSIEHFHKQYPDYDGVLIILPEIERDDD